MSDREMVEAFQKDGIKLVIAHRRQMPLANYVDEVRADMFYGLHSDLVDRLQAQLSRDLTTKELVMIDKAFCGGMPEDSILERLQRRGSTENDHTMRRGDEAVTLSPPKLTSRQMGEGEAHEYFTSFQDQESPD